MLDIENIALVIGMSLSVKLCLRVTIDLLLMQPQAQNQLGLPLGQIVAKLHVSWLRFYTVAL